MLLESVGTLPVLEVALAWFVNSWEIALVLLMLLMFIEVSFVLFVEPAKAAVGHSMHRHTFYWRLPE